MNWLPQGDLLSILAPSPNLQCLNSMGVRDEMNCVQTSNSEARLLDVSCQQVFTRTEEKLILTVFDYGKNGRPPTHPAL